VQKALASAKFCAGSGSFTCSDLRFFGDQHFQRQAMPATSSIFKTGICSLTMNGSVVRIEDFASTEGLSIHQISE
jgi:hypothetical protein